VKPYPFQERVASLLLAGKNVVLQAPTGSGKTRAALLPFLHARFRDTGTGFPRKCVYIVPMRVLAHQFVEKTREEMASYRRVFGESLSVSVQTGDQQDDPRFESDLVFCTIDQFLSSYLTMPYSLPNRLANLNAGAFIGTYLVFDEFHLLDPDSTLPSTLFALKQLGAVAPVLLMTATFSADMLASLAKEVNAEVVQVSAEEAHQIETRSGLVQPKRRTWHTAGETLSAAAVLRVHKQRSIAICNTVRRAQLLYSELKQAIENQGLDIEIRLLHSRFLHEDRKKVEEWMRCKFSEKAELEKSVIAVATQAIEVGLDISCENLHIELAPASAMIQRAGRCARYPGEVGQVWVYLVEDFMPYGRARENPDKESLWVKEMRAAMDWLREQDGEIFTFSTEQALINAVAARRDRQILESLAAGRHQRKESIYRVLTGDRQPNDTRLLVRDADSRTVLISSDPDRLLRAPFAATGFSLATTTLMGMARNWLQADQDVDWRVRFLAVDEVDSAGGYRTEYSWLPLSDPRQLVGKQIIVVNPKLAGYEPDEGFLADRGGTDFESYLPYGSERKTWEAHEYRLESFEDHIRSVLWAFENYSLPEIRQPAQALERAAGWAPGSVERAAWLVGLFHDVGKLSKGWQNWAHAYQQQIGSPADERFAIAHTDYSKDNPEHRAAASAIQGKYPKPHHAAEGALAVRKILASALKEIPLIKAALTAIARHHTPFAQECQPFSLNRFANEHIQAALAYLPDSTRASVKTGLLEEQAPLSVHTFSGLLAIPQETFAWLAYLLLARALRISDQKGTEKGMASGNFE